MEFRTMTFIGPTGFSYEIREQNGADEDILSNPYDSRNLMNLTKFIAAIVVKTDFTQSGKLTLDDSLRLPLNDRYAILFKSRIFSLGDEVEFEYDWGKDNGGKITYGQDLNEFLYEYNTGSELTEEELDAKPLAIPFYPLGKTLTDLGFTTSSGKEILFDILNTEGERKLIGIPEDKQTRNSPLLCRNLRLNVDGKFEKVSNFSIFTVKDMSEIRKHILSVDPLFEGLTHINHPITEEEIEYPILMSTNFFYLTEA